MKWAGGDATACRAAARDLHGLSEFLSARAADLQAMDDWVEVGAWTGKAAEVARDHFGDLVTGLTEFAAGTDGLGDTMDDVAGEIDKAVARAKVALIVGGVLFTIGTAATIVTIGASEGAAAIAAAAGEEEAGLAFAELGTYLSTAFTTALTQNTLRVAGAIGFNLVIPAVGEAVHLGVTGGEWTWSSVAGILIGSSFGILLGELGTLAQLNLTLPFYQEVLAGAVSIGTAGFAGSAAGQQLLNGEVDWKVAGYSGAAGAVAGAVGATGAHYIINRFKVTPEQLGAVVQRQHPGEIELPGLGRADQLTLSEIPGAGGTGTTLAQDAGGGPMLSEEALTSANLSDAALGRLGAAEGRLGAAGQFTAHSDRLGHWLGAVVGQRSSTDAGLDGAVAATGGGVSLEAAAARRAGGRLTVALAEAQADDGRAASEYVTAASSISGDSDSTAFFSARSTAFQEDGVADLAAVHEAATEYAQSLRQVEQSTTLATVGPDITALGRVAPEIQAQIDQADALAAASGPSAAAAGLALPDVGAVDPSTVLAPAAAAPPSPEAAALIRQTAIRRIAAQSAYGIVLGSTSGAVFGGAVLPRLEEPDTEFQLAPPATTGPTA